MQEISRMHVVLDIRFQAYFRGGTRRTVAVTRARLEVPMSETLTERDLRALMAVVEEGRRDEPTEGLPWAGMEELFKLVRCDSVSFPEVDLVRERGLFLQGLGTLGRMLQLGAGDDRSPAEYWDWMRAFLPCTYAQRTGDYATVVRWSDFYTQTELRNQPLYAEFIVHEGNAHGLHASLPALPGCYRKISFWREPGSDFTERDRLVVELLRPHLWELFLESQRRLGRVPELTPREWEVLRLAHEGNANKDIAAKLFISVGTVRKHFEHIFDRTGARSRAAAAALMMPHQPAAALPERT
jgi:DNA-binding CsgD family transcriptional regulator